MKLSRTCVGIPVFGIPVLVFECWYSNVGIRVLVFECWYSSVSIPVLVTLRASCGSSTSDKKCVFK